jgi:hypothetical protein
MRIGFAIAWALAIALPAGAAAPERIDFGPPGPPQSITFADAVMSATVTFRISHDARYDGGPAGLSPSISSGSLAVHAYGVNRNYDLAAILPILTARIVLSKDAGGGCGTATALSRRGSYLVVEAVLAEKGCAPFAAFVDLRDGRIAQEAIFDPAWVHRFDVHPYRASGVPIRIVRVERVVPEAVQWNGDGTKQMPVAWPFLIVHATDARGATLVFAIDPGSQVAFDGRTVTFHPGEIALAGTSDIGDADVIVQYFTGQLFIRPGAAAEARFEALQTPTPDNVQAGLRRNHWFDEASARAERGDFPGAVAAFATMVSFHGGGDEIDANDAAMLSACRNLLKRVRSGALSSGAASAAFSNGCVIR